MTILTMEQINAGLLNNKGVAGKIMNKRQMESMNKDIKALEEEVRVEIDIHKEIARYTNALTMKDVAINTTTDVPRVEAEYVGVDGVDFEVGFNRDVELPSWCVSHANTGIRYTDSLEPLMTW